MIEHTISVLKWTGILLLSLAFLFSGTALVQLTVKRALGKLRQLQAIKENNRQHSDDFLIVCQVCETRNWFSKNRVSSRLDNPNPQAECDGCKVNVVGEYMEHPFVLNAQAKLDVIKERNKQVVEALAHRHPPVTNEGRILEEHTVTQIALVPQVLPAINRSQRNRSDR